MATDMSLTTGNRVGNYEVLSAIGKGGNVLLSTLESKTPTDWFGRFVLYRDLDPSKGKSNARSIVYEITLD